MQSRKLGASFECLNCFLKQLMGELWCCKVMVFDCVTWVLKVKTTWHWRC